MRKHTLVKFCQVEAIRLNKFVTMRFVIKPLLSRRQRRHQRGQMAIFIALIFQVLFVLFAMAINVALVVHDKINLQNAVDLAAYYAAQKQAEMLNAIAQQNYGIRQAWKLLTWRYRALGSSGPIGSAIHPWRSNAFDEAPHGVIPAICMVHATNWLGVDDNQSLCKDPVVNIPALPVVPVISPLPFNVIFSIFADQMISLAQASCQGLGGYNWWFGMSILQAFREDQKNRKQVIYALANSLARGPNGDFVDLDGNSAQAGARQTFVKNLTFSNSQALVSFKMMNSFEGLPRERWLNEIKISPTLLWVDTDSSGGGCRGIYKPINETPQAGFGSVTPQATPLIPWKDVMNQLVEGDYQFSLGVEKNPWVMAYVGIQAETAPRQIFFPFGEAVQLKARAFAKPFGGRMGPWYGSRWPRSSVSSTGPETDPLLPQITQQGGIMDSPNPLRRLPNYSRFPGDTMGLTSRLAINAIPAAINNQEKFDVYKNTWITIQPNSLNDPLAFDPASPTFPKVRYFEIAAIAPDLFDLAYYSVEPAYGQQYRPRLVANKVKFGIPDNVPVRGDLGENPFLNTIGFSVKDQMEVQKTVVPPQPLPLQRPEAFYFARDKSNLLTGWTTGEFVYDYSFPADRFGKCAVPDDNFRPEFKVPGACGARGGRNGYSVKLVSREYLFSTAQPIGGQGEAPGIILNPPPAGW